MIALVGPSGVGKDSVMAGLCDALPGLRPVRRVTTRAAGLTGEEYVAVSPAAFDAMVAGRAFAIHWEAHGLRYGISAGVKEDLAEGADCVANVSRGALCEAAATFPRLKVLNITARPDTLARRLAMRGRETEGEIATRLARRPPPLPRGLDVIALPNDGPLSATIALAVAALQPASV